MTNARTLSPREALEWAKNALAEMSEFSGNPEFITYETPLTQPMIEFLSERAVQENLSTNIGFFALEPNDRMRTFINQINTDGRF